jgi:hypothetical protein
LEGQNQGNLVTQSHGFSFVQTDADGRVAKGEVMEKIT